jgi:hypothetical protein
MGIAITIAPTLAESLLERRLRNAPPSTSSNATPFSSNNGVVGAYRGDDECLVIYLC